MTTHRSLLSATLVLGAIIAAGTASAAQRDELSGRGWCRNRSQGGNLLKSDEAVLAWQGDGNLVLYNRLKCSDPSTASGCGSNAAIWASGTNGRADTLCFQGDGNLVIYGATGAVWATGTEGTAFRTQNGNFLVANEGGGSTLRADRTAVGLWEKFYIRNIGGGKVALQTRRTGHYVVAEGAGGGDANANRSAVGAWEQFYLDYNPEDATHSIRAANSNYYLRAEGGGGYNAFFDVTWKQAHERYRIIEMKKMVLDGCRFSLTDDTALGLSWWGVGSCNNGNLGIRQQSRTGNSFGNNNFGAGYEATLAYQVPYAGFSRAFGEGSAWARLFGNKVTILGASGSASSVNNVHTAAASLTVMGTSVPVTVTVEDRTLFSVEKTFFERSQIFMAGPIPVTVSGSATGSLGLEGSFTPGASGASITLSPYADLSAGASASVGVACASAGVAGELSLINVSVPFTAALDFLHRLVSLTGDIVVSSLSGSISLEASYCVGSTSWELVSWPAAAEVTIPVIDASYAL